MAENKQLQKRCAAIMAGKKGNSANTMFDDELRYSTVRLLPALASSDGGYQGRTLCLIVAYLLW